MPGKPLKQRLQQNQITYLKSWHIHLIRQLFPFKISSFFHYNNLMDEFPLSSVRNSNKFCFDTLTNLQQSFISMFYKKKSG